MRLKWLKAGEIDRVIIQEREGRVRIGDVLEFGGKQGIVRALRDDAAGVEVFGANGKAMQQAAQLFEDFTGTPAAFVDKLKFPDHRIALGIGTLDGVIYTTWREGEKQSYLHDFAPHARPLLGASHDGQQLYVLGGGYRFTERGIVDAER